MARRLMTRTSETGHWRVRLALASFWLCFSFRLRPGRKVPREGEGARDPRRQGSLVVEQGPGYGHVFFHRPAGHWHEGRGGRLAPGEAFRIDAQFLRLVTLRRMPG